MPESVQTVTYRDLAIVRMVYSYNGCAVEHIRRRFFPTPGGRSPCYRRIAYLVKQGFLASTRLPALSGLGSGKTFLTVDLNARPILAQMLGLSRSQLICTRMASTLFIAHHLALCDVRLAFEMAADCSDVFTLKDWIGDRELHQSPLRLKDPTTGRELPLIPDSLFTLAMSDGTEQSVIVEVDMDTICQRRLRAKLRGYLLAIKGPVPVLFVVPNSSRQAQIVQWAIEEAKDLNRDPTLFFITTREALTNNDVLSSPIWQVAGAEEPVSLASLVVDQEPSLAVASASYPGRGP